MAEPIEMQFEMLSWMVSMEHVLHGDVDAPREGALSGYLAD